METLAAHVEAVSSCFQILDVTTLLAMTEDVLASPDLYVLFTFDDGYRSGVLAGSALLAEYGVRAVAFVSPWHIDNPSTYWWDILAGEGFSVMDTLTLQKKLSGERYMEALEAVDSMGRLESEREDAYGLAQWAEIRCARERIDIGYHGFRHDAPISMPIWEWAAELDEASERFLQEGVSALPVIAYPYGYKGCVRSEHVEVAAKRFKIGFLGIHQVASTECASLLSLPRFFATERTGASLCMKLATMAKLGRGDLP